MVFNPTRLDLARRRRGKTKVDLAVEVGVSTRILTAYESGHKQPGSLTLTKLSRALDFPEKFFSGPDLSEPSPEGSSFRALTTLTAQQRHQALAAGALSFALSEWIANRFTTPTVDVPRYQTVDPETAAIAVRSEWQIGDRPAKHMIRLLEQHGVRVFSLADDCVEMDAYSLWHNGIPYVFMNTTKSGERSRMDAAHELGHLVLHAKGGPRGREAELEA